RRGGRQDVGPEDAGGAAAAPRTAGTAGTSRTCEARAAGEPAGPPEEEHPAARGAGDESEAASAEPAERDPARPESAVAGRSERSAARDCADEGHGRKHQERAP